MKKELEWADAIINITCIVWNETFADFVVRKQNERAN
jgi:hypothetical protein